MVEKKKDLVICIIEREGECDHIVFDGSRHESVNVFRAFPMATRLRSSCNDPRSFLSMQVLLESLETDMVISNKVLA